MFDAGSQVLYLLLIVSESYTAVQVPRETLPLDQILKLALEE